MSDFDKTSKIEISAIPTNDIYKRWKPPVSSPSRLNKWTATMVLFVLVAIASVSYYLVVILPVNVPSPDPSDARPHEDGGKTQTIPPEEETKEPKEDMEQFRKDINEIKNILASMKLEMNNGNAQAQDKFDHFVNRFSNMVSGWKTLLGQLDHWKNSISPDVKPADLETLKQQIELMQSEINKLEVGELKRNLEVEILNAQDSQFKQQLTQLKELLIDLMNKPQIVIAIIDSAKSEPRCFANISPQLKKMLPMAFVDVQQRTVPDSLRKWMKNVVGAVTESSFYVMRREVTIGEFRQYVAQLSAQQQSELGDMWQKSDSGDSFAEERPVASVPWWAAQGYAAWFSKQTSCQLELPNRNQWAAAVIQYADPTKVVVRRSDSGLTLSPQIRSVDNNEVIDLLGNLREWSTELCAKDSYFLLGEDFKTYPERISGLPLCQTGTLRLDMNGFRLILKEKQSQEPSIPTAPKIIPASTRTL